MAEWVAETDSWQVWNVPPASRFVEYDESDREWMEPLGIGVVHYVFVRPMFKISREDLVSDALDASAESVRRFQEAVQKRLRGIT